MKLNKIIAMMVISLTASAAYAIGTIKNVSARPITIHTEDGQSKILEPRDTMVVPDSIYESAEIQSLLKSGDLVGKQKAGQ